MIDQQRRLYDQSARIFGGVILDRDVEKQHLRNKFPLCICLTSTSLLNCNSNPQNRLLVLGCRSQERLLLALKLGQFDIGEELESRDHSYCKKVETCQSYRIFPDQKMADKDVFSRITKRT